MAFEQYFAQGWKSTQSTAIESGTGNVQGCFECNICLDFANEPIVTLCGHLYCWPCIFKWLHVQSDSLALDEHPQCPVCKAEISHEAMVPLYGRGQASVEPKLKGMKIPPRPTGQSARTLTSPTSQTGQQLPYRNPYQNPQYNLNPFTSLQDEPFPSPPPPPPALFNFESAGFHHSMVGMFGEMFYTRVFGNSEGLYGYPNSYRLVNGSSPRMRRQEMQADKSLNRISIFIFCCFLLCLIVF
ncbi:hypothetical protein SAY87_022885 [Trapa incisa]|uniref:E3 ubiquitin-protein ligase RMA n=1 Tax=Trapa incisa TaxID=236973 RepID=A0AAN7Q659_9MYRT|nr:hypothetical protein SAY87_022885 [Trapa incisa]